MAELKPGHSMVRDGRAEARSLHGRSSWSTSVRSAVAPQAGARIETQNTSQQRKPPAMMTSSPQPSVAQRTGAPARGRGPTPLPPPFALQVVSRTGALTCPGWAGTDEGVCLEWARTDEGVCPEWGRTDEGVCPEWGRTDEGVCPEWGRTDEGVCPEWARTDEGVCPTRAAPVNRGGGAEYVDDRRLEKSGLYGRERGLASPRASRCDRAMGGRGAGGAAGGGGPGS